MSAEENKEIVRSWLEGHTSLEGAEKVAEELAAPDLVWHAPPFPDVHGPEGYKEWIAGSFQAYPDLRLSEAEMLAEGENVAVRWALSGTHQGTTRMGVAPTGKRVSGTGISIFRIADGKVSEVWMSFDFLGLMQQIGAFPAPGQQQEAATT